MIFPCFLSPLKIFSKSEHNLLLLSSKVGWGVFLGDTWGICVFLGILTGFICVFTVFVCVFVCYCIISFVYV